MCFRLPLYLVVLEDSENDSRYLGTITIPLLRIGCAMRDEMQVTGLRKPFVNGEKGQFNIFDLMGLSIGSASVSYRIYCLGNLALPHIPPTDVSTGNEITEATSDTISKTESEQQKNEDARIEKVFNVTPSVEEKISVSVPCQTDQPARVEKIVLDEQPKLVLADTNMQTEDEKNNGYDVFAHKNPPNLFYCRTQTLGYQQTVRDSDVAIDDLEKKLNETDTCDQHEQNKETNFASMNKDFDSFPILEALMKEIELIKLQRPRDRAGVKSECEEKVTQTSPTRGKKMHKKPAPMNINANTMSGTTDRPKSGMLHQSSTNAKHSHRRLCELRVCDRVPAQISWIRTSSVPTPGRRSKSKLEYGLTSSYLARLRNSNPSLFESLPLSNSYLDKSLDHEGHANSIANKCRKEKTDGRFCRKAQKGACEHKCKTVENSTRKQRKSSKNTKSAEVKTQDLREDGSAVNSEVLAAGQQKTVLEIEVPSQNFDLLNDSFEKLISSPVYMNQSFDQPVDVKLEDIDDRLGRIDSEENIETGSPFHCRENTVETTTDKIEANIAQVSNRFFTHHAVQISSHRSQSSEEGGENMNGPNDSHSHSSNSMHDMTKHGISVNAGKVLPVQRSYSDDFDQDSENGGLSPSPPVANQDKVEQILLSSTTPVANLDKDEMKDDQSLASSGSYSHASRRGYQPTFGRR